MTEFGTWLIQLLGFAATAGVISGLLTHYLNQRQLQRQRRDASAYAAIRLAVIFEHFADDCTDVLHQNNNNEDDADKQTTVLPTLAPFPADDDGWKALPPDLANETLSFPQRIKAAKSIIKSALDFADHGVAVQEANEQAIILGSRAWHIATNLRKSHGFAELALEFPFQDALLDELPAVKARRMSLKKARQSGAPVDAVGLPDESD